MTYLLKHKNNRSKNYRKVGSIVVFGSALIIIFYFWSGVFSPLFLKVLVPVSNFFSGAKSNMELAFKLFEPELSLVSENKTLKKRVAELEAKEFDTGLIADENAFLREELGLTIDDNFILSYILLMPPQTPYDSLLIDRGEKSGVFVGAKVLSSQRSALGYIEEVYKDFSRVKMFSSAGIKTNATLEKDGTFVELEGRGGGNFFLEAPLGFSIEEGDLFLLPGSERMVVAVVGSVKREETASFISVLLRAPMETYRNYPLLVEVE